MSAANSTEAELRNGAEQTVVTEASAACFDAAATSCFGSENGLDAVSSVMSTTPRVWDVLARFVIGRTELIGEGLRHFLAGWCVGCVQIATPPGVTEQALDRASNRRFGMDARGGRLLNEAIKLGLVRVNGPALRWFREGWMVAVSHLHNCVEADADAPTMNTTPPYPAALVGDVTMPMDEAERPPTGTPWQGIDWYSVDLGTPGMDVGLRIDIAVERIGMTTDNGPVYTMQRLRQFKVAETVVCDLASLHRDRDELTPFGRFEIVGVEHLEASEGPTAGGIDLRSSVAPGPAAVGEGGSS